MNYQIRQKIFSFGDSFTINDSNGNPHFQVEGKVFSFGDKLRIYDMAGNELFYIEQQLLKLFAEYNLYQNGQQVATCKQKFSFLGAQFDISSSQGEYQIQGKPLSYNFQILKNGSVVANINKQFLSLSDTYEVSISDSEDQGFMIALVIIIDQVVHDNNKNNH